MGAGGKTEARRLVREAQAERRREAMRREAACEALQVEIVAGLRRAEVARREAGAAVDRLVTEHGLTLAEVVAGCPGLSVTAAAKLRRDYADQAAAPVVAAVDG